jgi:hypothetical protein
MQDQTMWFGWYLMLIGLPFVVRILTVKELPIPRKTAGTATEET